MLIPFEFSYQKVIRDRYLYAVLMYPYAWAREYHSFLFSVIIGIWVLEVASFSIVFSEKSLPHTLI